MSGKGARLRRIEKRQAALRDGLSVRQFVRERMRGRQGEAFNKRSAAAKGWTEGWPA